MLLVYMALMTIVTAPSFAATTSPSKYSITYYDCAAPRDIKSYAISDACEKLIPIPEATSPWQILQVPQVKRLKGTKCSMRRSVFYYTCGSWGHLKTATVPEILHEVPVSNDWCRSLVHTRQFTPPGSTEKFQLAPDTTNVIRVETTGKISRDKGAVSCTGEPGRIDGAIMPSILVLIEYHVTILPEHFLIHAGQVESLSDHLRLPSNCLYTQRYCETSGGTYIWELTKPTCDLELVSRFEPYQQGSLLIDEKNKILLNITRPAVMPTCGLRELHYTELTGILVLRGADPIPGVSNIDPSEVRTDTFVSSISAYVMFSAEQKIAEISSSWRHQVCRERWAHRPNEPQRLAPNLWGMRRGDLIYTMDCPTKTARIIEKDVCHSDIPVSLDPPLFVDPVSRLARTHSAIIPCSKRMPMRIKTTYGTTTQWVELSPHLRRATAPLNTFPVDEPITTHEDLSHSGIYTQEELDDWALITQYPFYETALVNEISLGSCSLTGKCGYPVSTTPGVRPYDLNMLLQKTIKQIDIWDQVNDWILQHGAYLAALVLLLTALQWGLNIILLATALVREGPAQTLAIASVLFCSGPQHYGRIQRRHARQLQREAEEQRLLFPLQPATAPTLRRD